MKPAERMRVIFVSPGGTQGRGGIQSMTRYMIERLSRRDGIECLVLDPYGVGSKWQMPFRFLSALVRLPFLALRRPAVVHSNMSFGGSALRKLLLLRWGCLFGIPTVLHLHGSEFAVFCDRLPPFPRRMLIASMVRAARIVVIGTYWKNYLVEQLGIDPDKVLVIHNGVPMPARRQPREATGKCRIVSLGKLGHRKGTSDLLKALASPLVAPLDWSTIIAGNGPVDEYREEARNLGLADRVDLPGWVSPDQAQVLLSEADIFILPSWNEGLPMAILEAMAAGLPVISTPVGAISDLVLEDDTGYLVAPGSVELIAERIHRLVVNPVLRARLGENGRQRVETSFTIETVIERFVITYKAALGWRMID